MEKLVSIITPTYNHERYIARCIDSALSQIYQSWEQIIVDDCSTDRTQKIIQSYNDPRIRYVRQDHKGIYKLAETYNLALNESKGELIAILEGDDYYPSRKLMVQTKYFDAENIILTWGKCIRMDDQGNFLGITPEDYDWFQKKRTRGEFVRKLLQGCCIPAVTVMVRKDALKKIGGFSQPAHAYYVDYPTWLELSMIGDFRYIDEALGYWGIHDDSASFQLAEKSEWYECSLHAFSEMPKTLVEETGLTLDALRGLLERQRGLDFLHWGRSALEHKQWERAKNDFREALKHGTIKTKFKALIGLTLEELRCSRTRLFQ